MQTKKGEPAKGCTAREFCEVMSQIQEEARSRVLPSLMGSQQQQMVWSFDNDRVHEAALAELRVRGLLTATNRAPLPPHSPDMHKVIEHCIGRLTSMVLAELADTEAVQLSVAHWQARLEDMFFNNITAESIAKDVVSLADTYRAIIDVEGAWPAKAFR
jgi:hypothetical protein